MANTDNIGNQLVNREPTNDKMRDKRFIAEHRSGSLTKEQHKQLIIWACNCAEHVLHLSGDASDERLKNESLSPVKFELISKIIYKSKMKYGF